MFILLLYGFEPVLFIFMSLNTVTKYKCSPNEILYLKGVLVQFNIAVACV